MGLKMFKKSKPSANVDVKTDEREKVTEYETNGTPLFAFDNEATYRNENQLHSVPPNPSAKSKILEKEDVNVLPNDTTNKTDFSSQGRCSSCLRTNTEEEFNRDFKTSINNYSNNMKRHESFSSSINEAFEENIRQDSVQPWDSISHVQSDTQSSVPSIHYAIDDVRTYENLARRQAYKNLQIPEYYGKNVTTVEMNGEMSSHPTSHLATWNELLQQSQDAKHSKNNKATGLALEEATYINLPSTSHYTTSEPGRFNENHEFARKERTERSLNNKHVTGRTFRTSSKKYSVESKGNGPIGLFLADTMNDNITQELVENRRTDSHSPSNSVLYGIDNDKKVSKVYKDKKDEKQELSDANTSSIDTTGDIVKHSTDRKKFSKRLRNQLQNGSNRINKLVTMRTKAASTKIDISDTSADESVDKGVEQHTHEFTGNEVMDEDRKFYLILVVLLFVVLFGICCAINSIVERYSVAWYFADIYFWAFIFVITFLMVARVVTLNSLPSWCTSRRGRGYQSIP